MSGTHPDLDVSGNEPDYFTRFDKPLVIPCYEKWSKGTEPTIKQLDDEVNYYVDHG